MKVIAFTYSLLKFVEWHSEVHRNENLSDFSTENNFTPQKIALLPYFLCTANGNREAMFSVFDAFQIHESGYIERDLFPLAKEGTSIKNVFTVQSGSLRITDLGLSFFNEKKEFEEDKFVAKFKQNFEKFQPNGVIKDQKNLIEHLNHSVVSLKKQDFYKNGGIMWLTEDRLSAISKSHVSYKLYSRKILEEVDGKIRVSDLIDEMSYFAGNRSERIETTPFELFQM